MIGGITITVKRVKRQLIPIIKTTDPITIKPFLSKILTFVDIVADIVFKNKLEKKEFKG